MLAEPKAVLWDLDGTLVDTEPIWDETQGEMLAERGLTITDEVNASLRGGSATVTAQVLAELYADGTPPQEIFDELHDRVIAKLLVDLPWIPGARELMEELGRNGVPCAIVTASYGNIVEAVRARLPRNVRCIVTGDSVANNKPHPEPYLTGADLLRVDPRDAVALEDSIPGARSALAAGSVVVAVAAEVRHEPHPRLRVAEQGLRGLTWADLAATWRELKDNV
ncbi:MAG: HAD family phosphatase [Tessaracoccus sp.]|uniref:HAD family hydrolase n=1 Tax=Tessaracoccus sp. TaxID=1971211 RepID=UPI001EC567B9|nr:HAD family phosphatase [Tessaracoccus sp.]MBK7821136.1 HAD family phosphatase [Tessaracoccus sp.]